MKSKLIHCVSILFALIFINANAQVLEKKTTRLFDNDRKLLEKTEECYNRNHQLVKSTTNDYRNDESITVTNYFYNEKGQLVSEVFSGLTSFRDNKGAIHWSDTSIIFRKKFIYNLSGQLQFEKKFSFQCNLDTCDITEFFYEGKLLIKKTCINECSFKNLNYNYPIYYGYDQNDSLILEEAREAKDTSKIWYKHTYDYSLSPEKFIFERYYRTDDSLQLDSRTVTKTEYRADGKKSRITFIENSLSFNDFVYYKNGMLKSKVLIRDGITILKTKYKYDKHQDLIKIETFEKDEQNENKLNLSYYQTYDYRYY